ncbi:hypothetical protein EXIGLDRAFT_641688 [Exidia glandulosa HHB12029]|uniref:GST N-terminal domain-containing protein n=1 Tax=Exidia glandulosa HHB12029 TaxID=1314781 RepID=A0A165LNY4_EXIGL|nr:hypothetical protein EXIGLDRAFT_641688 [Exidia glandulosa HHB12029]
MSSEVIVYRYDGSPFATKVENILALRNIPYSRVNVPVVPPRSALLELGIPYRRIPVVAIGNDVYCDTYMITTALERAFPPSQKHPSIFSVRKDGAKSDAVLQARYSQTYAESQLFSFGKDTLPWTKVPLALAQDRFGTMVGGAPPPASYFEKLEARAPIARSGVTTHLDYLEEQLSDGREWLFDTVSASYADAATHMPLAWMRTFKTMREVFDKNLFPNVIAWLDRFDALLKEQKKTTKFTNIEASEALQRVGGSKLKLNVDSLIGFDETEAKRLSLTRGMHVDVTPSDTAKVPTSGKLVGLNRREIVVQVESSKGATLAVHFPRLGYVVRAHADKAAKSKL